MKYFNTLTFLFLFSILFGQEKTVQWGEMVPSSGRIIAILPNSSADFYTLRYSGGATLGSYRLSNHKNFEQVASGKVYLRATNGMANFEDIKIIGNRIFVFLSDKYEGEHHFYMQEYSEDGLPIGDASRVASYSFEKGLNKGFFSVITSRDNKYLGVIWEIPSKKEVSDRYGFKIFDGELNEINSGDYSLPFEGRYAEIDQHYLSNTGDYFVSATEYMPSDSKGSLIRYMDYKAMHIFHITSEGLEDFDINLDGKRVEAISLNSDNKRILTLTGIYGDNRVAGVSGMFFIRANFDKQEIIDEGFEKFDNNFITQDWSDRQKEKADRRIQQGKSAPQLYNYVMRQTEVLQDGSIVGSLEQYYVQVNTYTDPRTGLVRQTFTYYFNDIIAFKIGTEGGFDWLKKINKYQVSNNDGGPFSSYYSFVDKGNLCFVFNDNIKNYDEAGNFIGNNRLYPANFGRKKNVVALVEIDMEDGGISRKTFFDRKEIMALAVPKLFQRDFALNEILLYAVYARKERFGILELND
jgi:hypothetical protein